MWKIDGQDTKIGRLKYSEVCMVPIGKIARDDLKVLIRYSLDGSVVFDKEYYFDKIEYNEIKELYDEKKYNSIIECCLEVWAGRNLPAGKLDKV
jgi:hypothetical protein